MNRPAALLFVAVSVVAAFVTLLPDRPSFAQDAPIVLAQNDRGGGFFRRLFGGMRDFGPPPQQPDRRQTFFPGFERLLPPSEAPLPRRERKPRATAPAAPPPVVVEKSPDAKRAMVIGDFMAGSLAKGMIDAYSQNANVVVDDQTSGSSGLVRQDFLNWPQKVPELVASEKPDAILVMIGANDRQGIDTDAGSQPIGSDAWHAAYAARVSALADALKATGKPVFWGGLVPVAPAAMARDYSAVNSILREQLDAKGLTFVDMWDGFADDEGKYVAVGPDVAGQSVQLRASDGLNFTRAGQRKLAYFFEQNLSDLFGGNAAQVAAVSATAQPGMQAPNAPRIGPMVPLDSLGLAGGDALSTDATGGRGGTTETISARLSAKDAALAPEGRADSYIWPPRPAPAGTPAPVVQGR